MIVGNEIHGLKVKHLHVGGVLGSGEVQNGIRGCVQVGRSISVCDVLLYSQSPFKVCCLLMPTSAFVNRAFGWVCGLMPPLCPAPPELSKWKQAVMWATPASHHRAPPTAAVRTSGRGTPVSANLVTTRNFHLVSVGLVWLLQFSAPLTTHRLAWPTAPDRNLFYSSLCESNSQVSWSRPLFCICLNSN